MLECSASLAAPWIHVRCSMPACTESIVPSTPWSQLHGTRETHQKRYRSSSAKGSSGKGGASALPNQTQMRPPLSWTGKWTTGTLAAKVSLRVAWVGTSTTVPLVSIAHP